MTGPSGTVTGTSDAYGQQGTQTDTYDGLGRDVGVTVAGGTATTLSYEGTTGQLTGDGGTNRLHLHLGGGQVGRIPSNWDITGGRTLLPLR